MTKHGDNMESCPLQRRILEEGCRPFRYLQAVRDRPYPVLLDSSQHNTPLGQYSILCWEPFKIIVARGRSVEVRDVENHRTATQSGCPFEIMSGEFDGHRMDLPETWDLPFAGGAVGYFSYDLRHCIEALPRECDYDVDIPDAVLCFYRHAIVFDHNRRLTEWIGPRDGPVCPPVLTPRKGEQSPPPIAGALLESNFSPSEYVEAVRRAKEYIAAGDIFQVNLSQRFAGECAADGLALYRRLRSINPAPFSAYVDCGDFEILSSSPERFLLVEGNEVITRPIKGTRPRQEADEAFNARMVQELLASEKDHAELAMIVDLERNDLGRVCAYGSVRVLEHAVLETYPTVYHLVSTVRGSLFKERYDEFALIKAAFPGGSITGAPKIRAMEVIEELEPHARNVYTGAIGYVSFHGRMDLNIVIRTILKKGDKVYVHVGGGIVADSVPELELEETLHKARALFQALNARNYEELMQGLAHVQPR